MPNISRLFDYLAGKLARGSEVRGEFDQIINLLDGGLDNDNIAAGANISLSKIAGMVTLSGHVGTLSGRIGVLSGRVTTLSGHVPSMSGRIGTLCGSYNAHVHTGSDGTSQVSHGNLTGVTADQHHVEFKGLSAGGTAVPAHAVSKQVEIVAGSGITLTPSGSKITIDRSLDRGYEIFSTPGVDTFTTPAGVTELFVTVVGGGGAGGGGYGTHAAAHNSGGGGGGGGSYTKVAITTAPSRVHNIVVGTGGTAGAAPSGNGGTGGLSSIAPVEESQNFAIIGSGGIGGLGATVGGAGTGGTGGKAHTDQYPPTGTNSLNGSGRWAGTPVGTDGGTGGNGDTDGAGGTAIWGGGGAGSLAGCGGKGGQSTGSPSALDGSVYGGGGGGGSIATQAGGTGANGVVIVEWFIP